ncbi:MAG: serine/threonine-protein kinase PknK [Vicinamibacterales bacterium]
MSDTDTSATAVRDEAAQLFLYVADMRGDLRKEFLGCMSVGKYADRVALETLVRQAGLPDGDAAGAMPADGRPDSRAVAAALCAFLKAASAGDQPELPRYVPDPADPNYERTLVELVKVDQKLRASARQPKALESYLREWPALAARPAVVAELLHSECLSRTVFAASVTPAELVLRFEDIAAQIDLDEIERLGRPVAQVLNAGVASRGLKVPERFSIVRAIGKGGMGLVYEAIDRHRGTHVALKSLPKLDPNALYRFKREFRTLAGIAHPNLVPPYELISDGSVWFFTMELVDGINFISHVRPARNPNLDGEAEAQGGSAPLVSDTTEISPANLASLRSCLRQLAVGVSKLHAERILHRDIKPSNVLVRADGHVMILDFGVAKEMSAADVTSDAPKAISPPTTIATVGTWTGDQDVVGSVPYMSPEQARAQPLTEASDWYAVGAILYEALTGSPPFTGTPQQIFEQKLFEDVAPPNTRAESIPDDLNDLCVALLQRDPLNRPSGAEVLERVSPGRVAGDVLALRPTAFVGRDHELALLANAYRELEGDRAVTAHVQGRSGAGKTALVQRFIRSLPADVVVLSGRCYEQESVPYKALDSIVDALCRRLMSLPDSAIEELIPADIAALARIFPVLERVGAVRRAIRGRPEIPDVHELRRRAFAALGDMLQRLGRASRLVLFIDDLQWGDLDSAALLISFLDAIDPPKLLLIASYRSEYATTSACLIALHAARQRQVFFDVTVEPLPYEETLQLATLLLPESAGASAVAERVARESGGSPYFVFELAQHGVHHGGDRAAGALDLDEALWQRVLRLPSSTRHLLEAVAVAGKPLPVRIACGAAFLGDHSISSVSMLRAEHLVRTTGPALDDEIETFHDRIRESVSRHVLSSALTAYHRQLATLLEEAHHPDIEATASHFHGAGLLDKAAHHYAAAADNAAAALAFERSAELYGLALHVGNGSVDKSRDLRRRRADALANAGRGYAAGREYQRAAEGGEERSIVDLQCKAGYQYCVSGHIDEGREAFAKVLAHFGKRLPRTRRKALLSLAVRRLELRLRGLGFTPRLETEVPKPDLERVDVFWSVATGMTIADPIRGAEFQTHDLILALRAGEPYRISRALAWEAAHVSMNGIRLKPRSDAHLTAADALASQLNRPHATGMARMSRGVAAYFHGDFKLCQRCCLEAAEIFRNSCTGVSWELETCNAFAFWTLYFNGEYGELKRRYSTLIAEVRARGARLAEADLTNFGGPFVWLADDDPDGARRAVSGVMGEWSRQDFQVQHFMTLTADAQIDLYSGDASAAWHRVVAQWAGVADAMLLHVEIVRIYMMHLRARCALAALDGVADRAALLQSADADARRLARERPPYAKALATTIWAALAFVSGDRERAITLIGSAANELDTLGWGGFGAAARRRHGQLLGGDTGRRIVQSVDDLLMAEGVKRPDKLSAVHVPGFPNA